MLESISIEPPADGFRCTIINKPALPPARNLQPEVALLDPKRLLKALSDDLNACREAGRFNSSEEDRQRGDLEFSTLTTHVMWAESVGFDQSELERIVHSLEANPFLRGYQRWRKRSEL